MQKWDKNKIIVFRTEADFELKCISTQDNDDLEQDMI